MTQQNSEPMRTAAGASMIRSDSALPFKDIVRSFDSMTQSIIQAIVLFNLALNKNTTPVADYDIIARGATSLVAKEVRGLQIDQLAVSLQNSPEEKREVDFRKFARARFEVRDMGDMLVSQEESDRRQAADTASQQMQQDQMQKMAEAQLRKVLSDAFKNIAAAAKNQATASAETIDAALMVMERGLGGMTGENGNGQQGASQGSSPGAGGSDVSGSTGVPGGGGAAPDTSGGSQGGDGGMPSGGAAQAPGGGPSP
jgi:ribosomal protein L22